MSRNWVAGVLLTLLAGTGLGTAGPAERPEDVRPLPVGARIPGEVALQTEQGRATTLDATLGGQPALLVFHRGGWCPYCDMQLSELRLIEPDLRALGYGIVAITPDAPAALRRRIAKEAPGYVLLSDEHAVLIQAFGIAFRLDAAKLGAAAARVRPVQPVPSVFIVDGAGMVRFRYVNPDYRVLVPKDLLLAAARAALPAAN